MSPWSTLQTDQTLPSVTTWGFIDDIKWGVVHSKGTVMYELPGPPRPSSAAQADTHAVWDTDGGFFMFCTGFSVESQPGSKCAEEKGLLLVWNTSLIITSVVFCSGHNAWAPISQQVFSPGPLGIIPEKAALGLGTLDALGELCGTAEEQQFLEDGRSPSWVSPSLCVFFCSIPAVWWAAPARMCLQTVGMTQF